MQVIGKIDVEKYRCITDDIITDEVIITDERVQHIKAHHPGDYEQFAEYFADIVTAPDYIIKDKRPNTAMVLKTVFNHEQKFHFRLALRIIVSADDSTYKNSIITFMKVREKEYERLLKNKNILYKRE